MGRAEPTREARAILESMVEDGSQRRPRVGGAIEGVRCRQVQQLMASGAVEGIGLHLLQLCEDGRW